jgi:hypothetical protein
MRRRSKGIVAIGRKIAEQVQSILSFTIAVVELFLLRRRSRFTTCPPLGEKGLTLRL